MIANARIWCGSEIDPESVLDGTFIKRVTGGEDKLVGRGHAGNETPFRTHSTPIIFGQDFPTMRPYDDANNNRCDFFSFEKTFMDKDTFNKDNTYHLQKDESFSQEMETEKFQNALVLIMIEVYTEYVNNGRIDMPEPESAQRARVDWVGTKDEYDPLGCVFEEYEFKEGGIVLSCAIERILKDAKKGITMHKFAFELRRRVRERGITFPVEAKKSRQYEGAERWGHKSSNCWFGLASKIDAPMVVIQTPGVVDPIQENVIKRKADSEPLTDEEDDEFDNSVLPMPLAKKPKI